MNAEEKWARLVAMVQSLPDEDRRCFEDQIGDFIHDVKQSIAISYSAQALLRRAPNLTAGDVELLDMIQKACQRSLDLLADFVKQFDHEAM